MRIIIIHPDSPLEKRKSFQRIIVVTNTNKWLYVNLFPPIIKNQMFRIFSDLL